MWTEKLRVQGSTRTKITTFLLDESVTYACQISFGLISMITAYSFEFCGGIEPVIPLMW